MSNRTKNILIGVLIIGIIAMTVAYAALSQTLNINGSAEVQGRSDSWNIHFTHIENSVNEVLEYEYAVTNSDSISLTETNTVATMPTVTLKAPGDYVEFKFDVINEGDITGYINTINNISLGTPSYGAGEDLTTAEKQAFEAAIVATLTYDDQNKTALAVNNSIAKNERKHLILTIRFNNTNEVQKLPKVAVTYSNITASIVYGQDQVSQGGGNVTPTVTPLSVGDVVTFGTEGFRVVWSNASETALLADYNLDTDAPSLNSTTQTNSNSTNYINFSQNAYWYQNNSLLPAYATDVNGNPADYSGNPNPYPYVYSNNSYIYPFVTGYVNNLKNNYNAPSTITGRLASYEEISQVCIDNGYSMPNWMQGHYWLGSSRSSDEVYYVSGYAIPWTNNGSYGIRPLIIVSTADVQSN